MRVGYRTENLNSDSRLELIFLALITTSLLGNPGQTTGLLCSVFFLREAGLARLAPLAFTKYKWNALSILIYYLGQGRVPTCGVSCDRGGGCKTETWFLAGSVFDFRAFLFLARVLTGFLKPSVQFNSFYLLQLLFPDATAQQTGRTSSLFSNNIRNWGWGKHENRMFCCILCLTVLVSSVCS